MLDEVFGFPCSLGCLRREAPCFRFPLVAPHLVDGVERHKGPQLRVEVQVPDDLLEGPEPAQGLEVRQRDGHLGLVVVVCVHFGPLGVELLGQPLVRMRLRVEQEAHVEMKMAAATEPTTAV